ncbi:hypothetical protein Ciccas_004877 [Cichlidogyrus casuarinus]|uniref:Uncharacterized protein n=1 Tax=Cichlidogyrus casuarinus TaxID=1844966 RepID=A0ABD2QAA8_9PLAT
MKTSAVDHFIEVVPLKDIRFPPPQKPILPFKITTGLEIEVCFAFPRDIANQSDNHGLLHTVENSAYYEAWWPATVVKNHCDSVEVTINHPGTIDEKLEQYFQSINKSSNSFKLDQIRAVTSEPYGIDLEKLFKCTVEIPANLKGL